jgi:hypothetical protein
MTPTHPTDNTPETARRPSLPTRIATAVLTNLARIMRFLARAGSGFSNL